MLLVALVSLMGRVGFGVRWRMNRQRIGEVHQRSGDGCGSPLQCFALLARLCGVSHMMGVRPRS